MSRASDDSIESPLNIEDLLFSSDDSDGFDVEVDGTSDQANYGSGSSDADTGTTTIPDGGAGSAIDADASATGPANPEFNQAVAHATHHHNLDFNQVRVMLAGTDDPFIHPMPAQVFHRNGPAPFVHPTPPVQFQGPFQPAAPVFHQDDSTATLPDAHHAPFVLAARRIPAIPGILAPVGGPVPYRVREISVTYAVPVEYRPDQHTFHVGAQSTRPGVRVSCAQVQGQGHVNYTLTWRFHEL